MGKVLHASGSGYFPSCIQNGAGYWSLQNAMDLYWRIRSWELNVTVTYTLSDEFGSFQTITTYPGYPAPPQPVLIDSFLGQGQEEYLVCGNNQLTSDPFYADINFGQPSKSGSRYDPGFNFSVEWYFEDVLGSMSFDVFTGDGGREVRPFSVYGSSPIAIKFSYPRRDEGLINFSFDNATFSLNPKEWFSYGGTYNTSTGARL